MLNQHNKTKIEKLTEGGRVTFEIFGVLELGEPLRKMLIVEDSADDERLILRAIRKCLENVEVIVARDGQAAIEVLQLESEHEISYPSVILSDLKLPLVDGEELVKSIRARTDGANATIIVFSSSYEDKDVERCRKAGANSFIQKPMEPILFNETIRKVLSHWVLGEPLSSGDEKTIPKWSTHPN